MTGKASEPAAGFQKCPTGPGDPGPSAFKVRYPTDAPSLSWYDWPRPQERSSMGGIRRREFIALLGGGAAWPVVARAQQQERMRHISLLLGIAENDPEARSRVKAFQQGLRDLGGWRGAIF